MPIVRRQESVLNPALADDLCHALLREMNRPDRSPKPVDMPVIIQEKSAGVPSYSRWYVIWNRFAGLDPEARGSVIMAAVDRKFGKKEVLRTSMVMGLTPDEPLAKEIFPVETTRAIVSAEPAANCVREPGAQYGRSRTKPRKTTP
jgi:hypothetical protein